MPIASFAYPGRSNDSNSSASVSEHEPPRVATERSNSRVVVNFATSATCYTECRQPRRGSSPVRVRCDCVRGPNPHPRPHGSVVGHKWAFRTLYEQVEYKAESVGVSVKQVGSASTSKRCAECGFTVDKNRPTRNDFRCVKCESEANADYNAAKNIGMRYVRRGQQSSRRTGNSQLALKSGTVTPSGVFIAHPEGFEVEFMDKPHDQKSMTSG